MFVIIAGVAHYVCLKCGQHDLTAEASRQHSHEQHYAWFIGLPQGESSYKHDKTKPATYFKAARKASEDDLGNPTKRKRTEPKPVITPKQDISRVITASLARSSRPDAYALATSSSRPNAYVLATSSSRPNAATLARSSSSRPDAYVLATSSSRPEASRAVAILDTILSPSSSSPRACAMAPSSTMAPLPIYLPSGQVEVNENADWIEQLSISSDNEEEDQLESTNKPLKVNSNDYVVDWKSLYYQSCQIIQSLETLNNNLNEAIMHYTGQNQ